MAPCSVAQEGLVSGCAATVGAALLSSIAIAGAAGGHGGQQGTGQNACMPTGIPVAIRGQSLADCSGDPWLQIQTYDDCNLISFRCEDAEELALQPSFIDALN